MSEIRPEAPKQPTSDVIDGDQPTGKQVQPGDPYVRDPIKEDHAKTARWLAYLIVGILVTTSAIHYAMVVWLNLTGHNDVAKEVAPIFDKWFPVVTGFAGSAITYFLTKERS